MIDYLSDEELNKLIAEVEADELVPAPHSIKDSLLGSDKLSKEEEYRRYKLRVIASAAAAIAILASTSYLKQAVPENLTDKLQGTRIDSQGIFEKDPEDILEKKAELSTKFSDLFGGYNIFRDKDQDTETN